MMKRTESAHSWNSVRVQRQGQDNKVPTGTFSKVHALDSAHISGRGARSGKVNF